MQERNRGNWHKIGSHIGKCKGKWDRALKKYQTESLWYFAAIMYG
jgi:hypothetical protein